VLADPLAQRQQLRVLPSAVPCAQVQQLVEELPRLHVHRQAQAGLADVLLEGLVRLAVLLGERLAGLLAGPRRQRARTEGRGVDGQRAVEGLDAGEQALLQVDEDEPALLRRGAPRNLEGLQQ
jgi:hypothetical protein